VKSLEINSKILILSVQSKEKINVYTYVDLNTNETNTVVGVKKEVALHTPLNATINVRFNREVFTLQDGEKKYLNTAAFFISGLKEVRK